MTTTKNGEVTAKLKNWKSIADHLLSITRSKSTSQGTNQNSTTKNARAGNCTHLARDPVK